MQKCYEIKRFSEELDFNYIDIEVEKITLLIENLFEAKIIDYYETRFGISYSIRFKGIFFMDQTNQSAKYLSTSEKGIFIKIQ